MVKGKLKKGIIKLFSIVYRKNIRITRAYLNKIRRKYTNGKHSSREIDLIIRYLDLIDKNNGVLIDVGAHTGSFLDSFLWGDWLIYAFEPDTNHVKIRELTMLSELDNVFYFTKACSNISGEVLPFYASDESTGISSLHAFHPTHKKIGEVETITLSEFIQNENIEDVRILKIDTEGHDLFVLKGFPWEYMKPSIIFCEFEDHKTLDLGYDFKQFGDYLLSKGYRVFVSEWYPVVKYGNNHIWRKIKSYPCELEDSLATGNFICFSTEIWVENYSSLITDFQVKQ
jgi:FkbM family methyltransferase